MYACIRQSFQDRDTVAGINVVKFYRCHSFTELSDLKNKCRKVSEKYFLVGSSDIITFKYFKDGVTYERPTSCPAASGTERTVQGIPSAMLCP